MPRRPIALCGPLAAAAIAASAACGGGDGSPTAPSATPTPQVETHPVDVIAFYDENANDVLDAAEQVRIPEATVEIAGQIGRTVAPSGGGTVDGVPAGERTVTIRGDTLPPYYQPGPPLTITVPTEGEVAVPVRLPIGDNLANRYLAFGDSITEGDAETGDFTYRFALRELLEGFFGIAEILNSGVGGTTSREGEMRIFSEVTRHDPAIVLVVYGTNDWNACATVSGCFTLDSLRSMVRTARNNASMPFLATILPANTGFDDRAPPSRNEWVAEANELIRTMAGEEQVVVMDIHAAFVEAASGGDYSALFEDHVHPNPAGYDLMARTMSEAITRGSLQAAYLRGPGSFGFTSFRD